VGHLATSEWKKDVYKIFVRIPKTKSLEDWNVMVSSPVTGLEWLRRFQEVKVPRLHDNSTGWW
jgi:hypothetical protein